jgi:hypothetical protein
MFSKTEYNFIKILVRSQLLSFFDVLFCCFLIWNWQYFVTGMPRLSLHFINALWYQIPLCCWVAMSESTGHHYYLISDNNISLGCHVWVYRSSLPSDIRHHFVVGLPCLSLQVIITIWYQTPLCHRIAMSEPAFHQYRLRLDGCHV